MSFLLFLFSAAIAIGKSRSANPIDSKFTVYIDYESSSDLFPGTHVLGKSPLPTIWYGLLDILSDLICRFVYSPSIYFKSFAKKGKLCCNWDLGNIRRVRVVIWPQTWNTLSSLNYSLLLLIFSNPF